MSCTVWEERISLLAGGDLDPAEMPAVENHLVACPECRALYLDLEEDQEALRRCPEMGDISARVMGTLRADRGQRAGRRWAVAASVAAAAIGAALALRPGAEVPPPPVVNEVRIAPPAAWAPAPAPHVAARPRRHVVRPQAPRPEAQASIAPSPDPDLLAELEELLNIPAARKHPLPTAPSVEIQIATANPNVTIILLPETKGDTNE